MSYQLGREARDLVRILQLLATKSTVWGKQFVRPD